MKIYIVIPAHNEAKLIYKTLQSLVKQTSLPQKIVVVDDDSTDETSTIVSEFSKEHEFIELIKTIKTSSKKDHAPGSKVINAFYKGFEKLDKDFDIICKFDADLIFPPTYLEEITKAFKSDQNIGMAGGFCTIQKNNHWVLENLTDKDHLRGALKAYRKECFQDIDGLKPAMGWDTVDELLAQYHGWNIKTLDQLQVKHLKPTGQNYKTKTSRYKQGEAFYRLRYGFAISSIASLKLAILKKDLSLFASYMRGYIKAKNEKRPFLVSPKEGRFIRNLRWRKMKEKLF